MERLNSILAYHNQIQYGSLSDKAYNILEELVVTLQLKPGSVWSEKDFSELIGIGRTPVREAIKKLEMSHLLEIVVRLGVKVADIRLDEFLLQMEVRRMLERLVAVRASKFATPDEREILHKLAERYKKATEEKNQLETVRIDNEFNHVVADCARNPFAKSALFPFHSLSRRLYYMQYNIAPELIQEINKSHIDLMNAIAIGEVAEAARMSDHLLDCIEKLTKMGMDAWLFVDKQDYDVYSFTNK